MLKFKQGLTPLSRLFSPRQNTESNKKIRNSSQFIEMLAVNTRLFAHT